MTDPTADRKKAAEDVLAAFDDLMDAAALYEPTDE